MQPRHKLSTHVRVNTIMHC